MDVEQISTKKVQEMTERKEIHCSDGQGPVVEIDGVIWTQNCINLFLKVVHNNRKPITKHYVQGKLIICYLHDTGVVEKDAFRWGSFYVVFRSSILEW